MSIKPHDIVIAWDGGALPTKNFVAGIIHPNLTSLDATLHGATIKDSWAGVMRRSDFSSLKTLIVRSYYTKPNIPKAIASLSVSQFVDFAHQTGV